ncbi:hypothetical protein C7999DRAFT_35364 [Corynascus novoguineensis]|uniref:Uncharacterized protein n=1 Tax=Corynascus novoguineensis TaxID=1126955 RepID=A0AAN7HJE6_9PEZI|nr:hypothetical protein C7999DRAFT_35364 [Corynascus novoguineensis]
MLPSVFNWLLLLQAPAAGVAIYATVLIFGTGTIPFVIAVVATGLHFLLGIYCYLNLSKPGNRCLYVALGCCTTACGGLWCGPLYYFARTVVWFRVEHLGSARLEKSTDWPQLSRWAKAGCAMSVLSTSVDLVLLGVLLFTAGRQQIGNSEKGSVTSDSIESPPQVYPTTGRVNRITLILAIARLQDPRVGTWAPTAELTALLEAWAGGCRFGAINTTNNNNSNNMINLNIGGQGHGNNGNSQSYGHGATALAHACLIDLCQTVWTAQREGREAAVLSAEELRTLEGLGWDLGWVAARIRRAGEFLERRRR